MNKLKLITLILLTFCFQSCIEGVKEMKSWIDASSIDVVQGQYHNLSDDGIKVFLPSVFNKYSTEEYKAIVKNILPITEYKAETKRLEILRKLEGSFTIFYDEVTRSTSTLNTLPYQPIFKRDAQYLLGMIRMNYEKNNDDSDIVYTKVTAKYNADSGPQIFKAVFKIESIANKTAIYNFTYIISVNEKTVWIQLQSPYENGVDDYLNKLIM